MTDEQKEALVIVLALAEGNALDDVEARESDLLDEYQRQQNALTIIHNFLYK